MFTLRPGVSLGVEIQGAEKMGIPCLVEDPAYILVRDYEQPTPAFSEFVQV